MKSSIRFLRSTSTMNRRVRAMLTLALCGDWSALRWMSGCDIEASQGCGARASRPALPFIAVPSGVRGRLGAKRRNQPDQPEHDARPDERHDEADEEPAFANAEQRGKHPTAQQSTDAPEDDVAKEAVTMAAHDPAGQRSCNQPDDDEHKKVHGILRVFTLAAR